jgi:hypothetical protein
MRLVRRDRPRRGSWRFVATPVAGAVLQAVAVVGSDPAGASTSCTYNPATQTINITIDPGQSAAVAVESADLGLDPESPAGAILFDDNGAGFDDGERSTACGSASNTNTTTIVVLGTPTGGEQFTIDNHDGAGFATTISWAINLGGGGPDTFVIDAGDGDDTVALGDGRFTLNGGGGEVLGAEIEQVLGKEGDDTIDASAMTTSVLLAGMGGDDTLIGGAGDDHLVGGDGTDRLLGGAEDDILDGGDGIDRLYGGDGTDTCILDRASATCDPSISLVPLTVGPGGSLDLSGAGWYPENGDVELFFVPPDGGAPQALTPAPPGLADWSIATTLTAPSEGGEYAVQACQPCGDPEAETATQTITVQVSTLQPTVSVEPGTVGPGDPVVISGEHWDPADGEISLLAELPGVPAGAPFATATSNADGHFETDPFEVPPLANGSHEVTACQHCGEPNEILRSTSFTVERTATTATLQLRPPDGSSGGDIQAVGAGWDPDGGRVRIFVDPSASTTAPNAVARVLADGSFSVRLAVPELGGGSYTVIACQQCNRPTRVEATATLTVPSPSPLPWILLGAVLLIVAGGGGLLVRRAVRGRGQPPTGDVGVRLRPTEPEVRLLAEPNGQTHEVRLVPRADPGVQRIRERSPR